MNRLCIISIFVIAVSCGLHEMDKGRRPESDGIWKGPDIADPSRACYLTALDYRDGYDWRSDTEKGTVKCSLTLFADGTPVLRVPVGDRYETSSDPMRHRIVRGHLYTDYTDGITTVMKMDGMEIYRYEGAEIIEEMIVRSGQVHTLCRPVKGGGFSYRINGHSVLERDSGNLLGHMRQWKDTVCFCFCQPVSTASGISDAYYMVKEGKVGKISMPEDVRTVWDMTIHEGRVCMAVSYKDGRGPYLCTETGTEAVPYILTQDVVSCRFADSDVLCLSVRCRYSGSNMQADILWSLGKSWKLYRITETLACSYIDGSGFNAAINPTAEEAGVIFKGDYAYAMADGYCIRGRSPMAVKDDVLCVGLSSRYDARPMVWRNGVLDTLDVNGPVTGLTFLR